MKKEVPEALERMVDAVLAYHPKPKKRKRRKRKPVKRDTGGNKL